MKKLILMTMFLTMNAYAEIPNVGRYDLTVSINNHIYHDYLEITKVKTNHFDQSEIEGFFQVGGLTKEAMKGTSLFVFFANARFTSLKTKVIENGVELIVSLVFKGTKEGEVYVDGNKIGKIESVRELGDTNNL